MRISFSIKKVTLRARLISKPMVGKFNILGVKSVPFNWSEVTDDQS